MSFRAGQTFLYPISEFETYHLWLIATDPNIEGQFAVVSFTSLRGSKDQTVLLRKAEHPFIRWDTCVAYMLADIITEQQLRERLESGEAREHTPVPADILALVLDGFLASDYTKKRIRAFISQYKATIKASRHST